MLLHESIPLGGLENCTLINRAVLQAGLPAKFALFAEFYNSIAAGEEEIAQCTALP